MYASNSVYSLCGICHVQKGVVYRGGDYCRCENLGVCMADNNCARMFNASAHVHPYVRWTRSCVRELSPTARNSSQPICSDYIPLQVVMGNACWRGGPLSPKYCVDYDSGQNWGLRTINCWCGQSLLMRRMPGMAPLHNRPHFPPYVTAGGAFHNLSVHLQGAVKGILNAIWFVGLGNSTSQCGR